ncbi:MAG: hypothetical protein ABJL99_00710 [Aliishimia sp.]
MGVHHASFGVLTLFMIYPPVDLVENLKRTAIHAVIFFLEAAALIGSGALRQRLGAPMEENARVLMVTLKEAGIASDTALKAENKVNGAVAEADVERRKAGATLETEKDAQIETNATQEKSLQQEKWHAKLGRSSQLFNNRLLTG